MAPSQRPTPDQAADHHVLLTRRQAMRRLALLGLSATAAVSAACSSTGKKRNRGPGLPYRRKH
ncbi:hypothetical protein [Mycobacterium parmense]|uniref:hypothetical protein n=1 Tax=Mycobacterium parmense TaxID=185642 RepID=UPI000A14A412|nr:hypothetical protein [Mycobacterium parmense]ORW51580.1 hypothetical protein AWC20_22775 [Mycobacterium parmense]